MLLIFNSNSQPHYEIDLSITTSGIRNQFVCVALGAIWNSPRMSVLMKYTLKYQRTLVWTWTPKRMKLSSRSFSRFHAPLINLIDLYILDNKLQFSYLNECSFSILCAHATKRQKDTNYDDPSGNVWYVWYATTTHPSLPSVHMSFS